MLRPERTPLPAPARRLPLAAALAALAAIALLLPGCGSSTSGTNAKPATAVPASAPLYAAAVVQPSGTLKTNTVSVAQRLTGKQNPFAQLVQALSGPGGTPIDFEKEVKPWLGTNAGLFITSAGGLSALGQGLLGQALEGGEITSGLPSAISKGLGSHGLQGALVLDTSNVGAARSFLEAQAQRAGAHAVSFDGVSYELAPNGVAAGIVHEFAVIGSESGMHGVIETTKGGPSLADAPGFSKLAANLPSGALAGVYLNPKALLAAVAPKPPKHDVLVFYGPNEVLALLGISPGAGASREGVLLLGELLAESGALGEQAHISIVPEANSLALYVDTLPEGPSTTPAGAGAQALAGLPGGSWLALGVGDGASAVETVLPGLVGLPALFSGSSSGGSTGGISLNLGSILGAVLAPLHSPGAASLRRELTSWMGPTAIFASGSSLLSIQAGVVVTATNAARARAAVPALAGLFAANGASTEQVSISGAEVAYAVKSKALPVVIDLAYGQGKFVLGLGPASVQEALSPSSALSSSASYTAAVAALGGGTQPTVMLDFPTLLTLMEDLGLNNDPTIGKVVPYLRQLTTLSGGMQSVNGITRQKLVIGLQPQG